MSWPSACTMTLAPAFSSPFGTFLNWRVTTVAVGDVDLVGRAVHGLHIELCGVDLHARVPTILNFSCAAAGAAISARNETRTARRKPMAEL